MAAAIGSTGDYLERAAELIRKQVDAIVIDSAHGHHEGVLAAVRAVKAAYPGVQLVAGNVATYEGARDLVELGIDGVKVGIGPGSICTTRVVSGAGVPQVTAIAETVKATRAAGVPLISDGGIKFSGDVTKAIAAGAVPLGVEKQTLRPASIVRGFRPRRKGAGAVGVRGNTVPKHHPKSLKGKIRLNPKQ